ncbi:MAG: VCBS repeat-containing protein [Caldilineaceae bacterium]
MRLLLYFVVVLQLFIITTSDLSAQGPGLSFVLQTQLAESDDTLALAAGDLDGDGTVDLIVGNRGQNRIYFNGDHAAFATVVLFGGNKTTVAIAIGDLNHDGYPDIVTNNEDGLQIFLNDGTGNVVLASTIGGAATVGDALRLGDLDGDGDYDIVVARAQANSVIYRNNGQGSICGGIATIARLRTTTD